MKQATFEVVAVLALLAPTLAQATLNSTECRDENGDEVSLKVETDYCFPLNPVVLHTPGHFLYHCPDIDWLNQNSRYFRDESSFMVDVPGKGHHLGEDWNGFDDENIPADLGDPIYAIGDGKVIAFNDVGVHPSYGNAIVIEHRLTYSRKIRSVFAHLDSIASGLAVGDCVRRGQYIGNVGDTGNVTGPHLHWEIRHEGFESDPFARNSYIVDQANPNPANSERSPGLYHNPTQFVLNDFAGVATYQPDLEYTSCEPECGTDGADTGTGGADTGPLAVTLEPVMVDETSATLRADVDPQTLSTDVVFLWGPGKSLKWETASINAGSGDDPTVVEASVAVACGGQEYYVKAVAENVEGERSGGVVSFTTPACTGTDPPPPFSITNSWMKDCNYGGFSRNRIEFEQFITGNGTQLYYDLYRDGIQVSTLKINVQQNGTEWFEDVSGLYEDGVHEYWVVARDDLGEAIADSVTITTPSGCGATATAPTVETDFAEQCTDSGALLQAKITGNGDSVTYFFEHGTDTTYGETTNVWRLDLLPHQKQEVSAPIAELDCGTYHFRAVAESPVFGLVYGQDSVFSTDCPATPSSGDGEQAMTQSTTALWHMNGPKRTLRKEYNEDRTNGYNLIPKGDPVSTYGFNGETDGAYWFDGIDDSFDLPSLPSPENHDLYWGGFVYIDEYREAGLLAYYSKWNGNWLDNKTYPQAYLSLEDTGQVRVHFSEEHNSATEVDVTTTGVVPLHQWTHIALTREQGVYSLFLNGVLDTSYDAGGNVSVLVNPFEVGDTKNQRINFGKDPVRFRGGLDEWHIVSGYALSTQEVSDVYTTASAYLGVNTPPYIELVEFEESDGLVLISWLDQDINEDASVSLWQSANADCSNATLIVSHLSEDAFDVYAWDTRSLPDGTYYVQATIDDSVNAPVSDCGGPVTVLNTGSPPTSNVIAEWEMDGALASALKRSDELGVYSLNETTGVASSLGYNNKANGSYVFDGSKTPLSVSGNIGQEYGSEGAIWAWVYLNKLTGKDQTIYYDWDYLPYKFIRFLGDEDGHLFGAVKDVDASAYPTVTGMTAMTLNEWHHVVLWWREGNPLLLFLDGVLDGASTTSLVTANTGAGNGAQLGTGIYLTNKKRPLDGRLDDVVLFGTATSPSEIADYYAVASAEVNDPPSISITEPDGLVDEADATCLINWVDDDPDDDAQIALFWSSDSSCAGAVSITTGVSEDDETDTFVWDTSSMDEGSYYVQAVADDGFNASVASCSGPVAVDHNLAPPSDNTDSLELNRFESEQLFITDTAQTGLDLSGDITIEAWVKVDTLPGVGKAQYDIVTKWAGTPDRSYKLTYWYDNGTLKILFKIFSSTGMQESYKKGYALVVGTWYHVAVSWDASASLATFYVTEGAGPAILLGTKTGVQTSITDSGANFVIGGRHNGKGDFFDGLVDEVRVWNLVRTASELTASKDAELGGAESGLAGYWQLDGDYQDRTLNGNHLSAQNSPVSLNDVPFN
ncbi:MAG: peptidoglycan DD-metalloendopeptidase family protein [bacterium]|nr:peptidoglycan DD-metalloendopeptidase family protein [bacterium]